MAKGKVWGLKRHLDRAEMRAEAFAQVAGVLILLERELRSGAWPAGPRSAGVPRSAPRPTGVPLCGSVHGPWPLARSHFLDEARGDVRFALISSFR